MNDILKVIEERKSLRVPFDTERPVSKQDLQQILEAARWTPTAHNMQNFEIVVVDDKHKLDAIVNIKRPISETFIRENYPLLSFSEEELQKKKVGILGNMFPLSWRTPDFKLENLDKEEIKEVLNIPKSFILAFAIIAGYPNEKPNQTPRKKISEIILILGY